MMQLSVCDNQHPSQHSELHVPATTTTKKPLAKFSHPDNSDNVSLDTWCRPSYC